GLRVAGRADRAGRRGDRRIVKRAQDVDEGIGILVGGDVDEGFGAARAAGSDQVGELDGGGHAFAGVVHGGEAVEALVGDLGDADRRLAFAVRGAGSFARAG